MSFEGFFTVCTTCASRLKVRDLSAIGQIFACPKCGSMVLVEAPEGMELDTQAEQNSDLPTDAEAPSGAQPSDWAGQAPTKVAWLGKAVGALAATVLIGSIGTFVWLKSTQSPSDQFVADLEVPASQIEAGPLESPIEPTAPISPESSNDQTSEIVDEDPQAEESLVPDQSRDPSSESNEEVTKGQPVTDDLEVEEIFGEATGVAADEPEMNAPGTLLSDAGLAPTLNPESNRLVNSDTLSNLASLLGSNATEPNDLADELVPIDSEEDLENSQAETRSDATLSNIQVAPSLEKSSHDSKVENVADKLAHRMVAVRFEKVPLVDFMRSMMQLSGVPIQLDSGAIEQSLVQTSTPVTVAAIDKSTLEILSLALKPINLVPIIEGNFVRITSARLEDKRPIEAVFFVGDLQKGRGGELNLATLIPTLVWPESWRDDRTLESRGDKMKATNSRAVLFESLVLLEKLRTARGLELRSKLNPRLLSTTTRWNALNRYLARPISINIWDPQPWPNVVKSLEQSMGLQILVDWKSLAQLNLMQDTETTLRARDQLASSVLLDFLDAYDLTVMPLSGKTVLLTSRSQMLASSSIEFYPLSKLSDDAMATVERLMLAGSAALDPGSDFAVVKANSETHRQLSN